VALDEAARRVAEVLGGLGQPYEMVACDPELADTADFCAAYGYSLEDAANTLVVVGKAAPARYVACVVLATTRLDVNHAVRDRLGVRKASFASAEETVEITAMMVGGVTPFALPADLSIWIDAQVMTRQRLVLGAGSRRAKVLGPPTLLSALPNALVVEALAVARP
jgi:prolyl-tRNA editing enzyme YbaK/EbsC (Cys-tRNA(Pro) deacylase)